jgi:cytochrome c oxidase assembly protein subunit 15
MRAFDSAKAWHEMIHRYFAAALVLLIAMLAGFAIWNRKDPTQPFIPVIGLFLIVCLQGALGAFTVTLLLKPLIVTLHLLGGLATLGLLVWLSRAPAHREVTAAEKRLRVFALIGFAVLCLQIALGGWTSTNYASLACPDFPTCQQSYWPTMDYRDAFVVWRGLGIDYEGGVLAHPARVAIHFTHRLGAIITGISLISLGIFSWLDGAARAVKTAGILLIAATLVQIALGVSTVHWGVPLGIATAHNAGAALLVISMVTLLRALWPRAS